LLREFLFLAVMNFLKLLEEGFLKIIGLTQSQQPEQTK
jgi:hypothetical protein